MPERVIGRQSNDSPPYADHSFSLDIPLRFCRLLTLPGYDALNDIVNQINPNSLAHAINQWLAAHSDLLPKTLALDGKDLGGKGKLGALVSLCHHHTGAPLAMRAYRR